MSQKSKRSPRMAPKHAAVSTLVPALSFAPPATRAAPSSADRHALIAKRAYLFSTAARERPSTPFENWLRAEREVDSELSVAVG